MNTDNTIDLLFSPDVELISFTTSNINHIPEFGSILYTVFLDRKEFIYVADSKIDGFNIGMNCGESAGQTVFHCHVHLMPRRKGDVENPRGGVRHIIAGKGFYEDKK